MHQIDSWIHGKDYIDEMLQVPMLWFHSIVPHASNEKSIRSIWLCYNYELWEWAAMFQYINHEALFV